MNEKTITGTVLNILSLEDSVLDFTIISEQLIDTGYNLNITRVEKEHEFTSLIRSNKYDIILSDFSLPGFNAFKSLQLCNEICPDVPFICVSGAIGEETAIELLKQGAVDYIMKDKLERLPFALNRALDEAKEKVAYRQVQEDLQISEKKYRNLVDKALVSIYTTNLKGKLLFANDAMCKMLEYDSIEELRNVDVKSTYKDQEEREKFKETIIKSKQVFNYELELITKQGKTIDVLVNAFISGELITGMILDISDRKRTEMELKDKMEELQRFHRLTVGRELAMIELKKEVNALLGKSGQEAKYKIVE